MSNTIIESEFEEFVFEQALINAINFKGSANPKAMIGKVMPKFPKIKEDMNHYMNLINNICEQVNKLSTEEQNKKLLNLNPNALEKKEKIISKKDGLPDLPNTENGVVVRFPPAPSGHLHLGHLFGIVANYEFKKKYGGKFILRFEDTNPDNIDLKNYEKVIDDVKWICDDGVDEIYYQSDRLPIYYKYLRTLFETNNCYVCTCDSETFKAYTDNKEECPHRKMSFEKKKEMFESFMKGEIEAVVRANANLQDKNPALRTFPLARLNRTPHARVGDKYCIWPNYNFAVSIDDSLMGLTHVIRGKDLEIGEERQKMIMTALNLKAPIYFHFGRLNFTDLELSKSKLTKRIEEGEFESWEDPRVPSIISYKKRGYKALAFRKFILSLGISKRDSKISSEEYHKGLDFFNKQILEEEADRYFFVHNPKKIQITNLEDIKEKEIKLPKHPDNKDRGFRTFKVEINYLIDSLDFDNFEKGDLIRLMHFANFKIIKKTKESLEVEFISKDYNKELNVKRNIHFVSSSNNEKVELVMQDNSKLKGICEKMDNLKEDRGIQFERFGFVKYDSKNKEGNKLFYFTHR